MTLIINAGDKFTGKTGMFVSVVSANGVAVEFKADLGGKVQHTDRDNFLTEFHPVLKDTQLPPEDFLTNRPMS